MSPSNLDRGPSTVDPEGPRSALGLWRLTRGAGIDAERAVRLAGAFPTWPALASATADDLRPLGCSGLAPRLSHVPELAVPNVMDGRVLSVFDDDFPTSLKDLPSPPPLLWVVGDIPAAHRVAIVGTRTPTAFGLRVAERAATEAVALGLAVVSGMADGVDMAAETTACAAGGQVVSVVGCGIDQLPSDRDGHISAILSADGAVVSEQPPGTPPSRAHLTARNRLQMGLSDAVVVAQASPGSSTAATVRFALVQGVRLIVPRPPAGSVHDAAPESSLLRALTQTSGMNPALIGLSGRHGSLIANRRPVADVVVEDGDALAAALAAVAAVAGVTGVAAAGSGDDPEGA